jgi:hypothetical protein
MKYNQYTSCRLKVPAKMVENIQGYDNKKSTQKSMDYKQKNKKIGDLHFVYVNIKSRVES